MQSLDQAQGDVVLDIVQQCRVVTSCYEQVTAARRDREAQKKGANGETLAAFAERTYQASLGQLTELYVEGCSLKVLQSTMDGVLRRVLPPAVVDALKLEPAA